MKKFLICSILFSLSLSSCMVGSLVTAPVKVAGDVAQGAYNVGKGTTKVIAGGNEEN